MVVGSNPEPFFLSVMFSSLGLFKQVDCPEGPRCALPSCIFSHQRISSIHEGSSQAAVTPRPTTHPLDLGTDDGPRKKRKVADSNEHPDITAGHDTGRTVEVAVLKPTQQHPATSEKDAESCGLVQHAAPVSILRPISPPPLRSSQRERENHKPTAAVEKPSNETIRQKTTNNSTEHPKILPNESLNPRMLATPPAAHTIRLRLITMMHEQMTRLNDEVKRSDDPSKVALELSSQELIHTVLDEEETTAKLNPTIYANVIKNRIGALKKMTLTAWKQERLKVVEKELGSPLVANLQAPKTIETGLSPAEEVAVLPWLLCQQNGLAKHGYVITQLNPDEIQKAREGVEAAQNWELCDRCRTRFQVFPGRRAEDGALTTGGKCRYHPAKPRRPPAKDKADKTAKESIFSCCNESVGVSVGCTTAETHVFKISDPKRLALVMPYIETPENPFLGDSKRAVSFDCEMGYTTQGLELIRLTATSWPSGAILLDTLVRPLGEVLDLNSRFSGVWPSDFTSAASPTSAESIPKTTSALASSPAVARAQLFNLISPKTPLIGHALENDLNAARIIHPSIIDTCLLYPHPRGLPIRHGLKHLMKRVLDREVQVQDGEKGHDSAEDARSAGDLVRLKVGEKWKTMKRDGCKITQGAIVMPVL